MGYVKCEKCAGYYELQKGESPDDFEKCQCGGKLKYIKSIPESSSKSSDNEKKAKNEIEENNRFKNTIKTPHKEVYKSKKEQLTGKFCQECGAENRADAPFCYRCGESFNPKVSGQKQISRTIELILGILGGVFGLLGGILAVIFGIFASDITGLGISAILASIVGMCGAAYVLRNAKWGGIILIVSAVWLLISISIFGLLGAVLLGLGGLLALLRK
jgi:ribosomal protein L40E